MLEQSGPLIRCHGLEKGILFIRCEGHAIEKGYLLIEHRKIAGVIERLFDHYVEHPELLPPPPAGASDGEDRLARRVTDYLAGMTDRYCIRQYTELEVPQAFAR